VRREFVLEVRGRKYKLGHKTWLMGVLNVTPDSFSDGGLFFEKENALRKGLELVAEGAEIIDIGGESARPGAEPIAVDEELRRVLPVLRELRKRTDVLISVDTTKAEVARASLEEGADIINDISALRFDPQMAKLIFERKVPCVLMHMKGTPKTMQISPFYQDVVEEVKSFLRERIEFAKSCGIETPRIIIDPGIGFGKRLEDNLVLLNNLEVFEELNQPLLVGVSRKSFIGKILNLPPEQRLEGTIASVVICIQKGAHILRVHDLKEVKRAIAVAEAILQERVYPESAIKEEGKNYVQ